MGNNQDATKPRGQGATRSSPNHELEVQLADLLSRGEAAARTGERSEALRLFRAALEIDRTSEDVWLWLAFLAPTPEESLACLQQAQTYHPDSERVRQAMVWAQSRMPAPEAKPERRQVLLLPVESDQQPPTRITRGPSISPSRPLKRASQRRQPARSTAPRSRTAGRKMAQPRGSNEPSDRRWFALGGALLTLVILVFIVAPRLPRAHRAPIATPTLDLSGTVTPAPDEATLRNQVNQALSQESWELAITLLDSLRQLAPDDQAVRQQLAVAHLRFGLQLADQDRLDDAIAHYDEAIRMYANDKDLQVARRIALGLREGRQAARFGQLDRAAALLEPIYSLSPDLKPLAEELYNVRMQQGKFLEEAGQFEEARHVYARAAAIKPDSQDAQARLAHVSSNLAPATPTTRPQGVKRIVVDLSEQRLRAYEGEQLLYDWICSTGGISTPTRAGTYQVLDKIPEAWSSTWALRMPYWMGIYWAGGSENGIHALPISANGSVLWSGHLGRRVSFGCIILDTPNAATLYNWADIGTEVVITD